MARDADDNPKDDAQSLTLAAYDVPSAAVRLIP
jgi:hypothetical protein